jgi:sugar lactone lactonase YvrE
MSITGLLLFLASFFYFPQAVAPETRGMLWRQESQSTVAAVNGTDNQARVQALSRFHADFPDNSRILRNLAWAQQRAGDTASATTQLKSYAEMGATLPHDGPIYAAMLGAGILVKVPQLVRNEAEVMQGSEVFALPDPDLLAEDIAFDPGTGRFLLTSARKNKIVSCDQNGNCRDVVTSGSNIQLDGMLAIHVDAKRKLLWATTAGMRVQEGFRPDREGHSALLKFDLGTFRVLKSYEPDDGKKHALGDMTVASSGDVYVSDGLSGDVYLLGHNSEKLELLVPQGVFVSPQTPALNKSESALYVPDYAEGLAKIDLATRTVEWVHTTAPLALEGIDGLYSTEGGLIATQNGTSPERVVRFHLHDAATLDGLNVIEANWPGLGDPTHGVVVGSFFYFIVNSGWDRVSDDESSFRSGAAAQVWKIPIA